MTAPEIPLAKRLAAVGRAWKTLHTKLNAVPDATVEDIARILGSIDIHPLLISGAASAAASDASAAEEEALPALAARTLAEDIPLTDGDTVTRRALPRRGWMRTAWVSFATGEGITDRGETFTVGGASPHRMLHDMPEDVTRVYVMGGPHELQNNVSRAVTAVGAVREWMLWPVHGWRDDGHYIPDADSPVGRWVRESDGRKVTMYRAATWLGEDGAVWLTPRGALDVMAWLGRALKTLTVPGNQRAYAGAVWMSTPATTGRDLMQRLLPGTAAYPVLSPELRELIQATSGQGRSELLAPVGAEDARTLPGLTYMDGRMMYAGLTWGMPDGKTTLWNGRALGALSTTELAATIGKRSRWRITYTVPSDWAHVGLLMTPTGDKDRGWHWPSEPGATATTWAGGSEVQLAMSRGWDIQIHEGMSWGETKALTTWTTALTRMYERAAAELEGEDQIKAARHAVRAIILHGIGATAPRGHDVTKSSMDHRDIPSGAEASQDATGLWTWQETAPLPDWSRQIARPEWAAIIWERARVRLLRGPTGATEADGRRIYAGALELPRSSVVAFRTDAIYTTTDPGWPDDGQAGRFRVKGRIGHPVPRPGTWPELFALRDMAEAEGAR